MAFGVQLQPLNIAALDQSALQSTALDREMREQNALARFLDMNGAGLASPNAAKREGVLSQMLGMGPRAMQFALPQINAARTQRETMSMVDRMFPGMGLGGTPAQPPVPAASVGSVPIGNPGRARAESGGNDAARNPNSTAGGRYQFLEGTWRDLRQAFPDFGRRWSDADRMDPQAQEEARPLLDARNSARLSRILGRQATAADLEVAHRLGADGAASVLSAPPNAPIASILPQQVLAVNPDLVRAGTAGGVLALIGRQTGGGAPAVAPAQGAPAAPGGFRPPTAEQVASIAAIGAATGNQQLSNLATVMSRLVQAPDRDLVQVDTPQGPRLVPRSQAVNAVPGGTTARGENELRDEFTKLTQNFRIVQDAYQGIRSAEPTGAGDMKLLYMYVKLLDPTSVVRESEFATAAASGSFGERVQGLVQRVISGQRLPESLRADFLREAESLYRVNLNTYNQVQQAYTAIARQRGLNPANVFPDLRQPVPPAPARAAQAGPTAGAASTPTVLPPTPGEVRDGYQFRGGNPRDQSNWVPVGPVSP